MRCTPSSPGALECCKLRRAHTPITSVLPRHDMEVEVWCFLPAEDAVVLKRQYAKRLICLDERLRDSPGRNQYDRALLIGKIEQCRDMPARDDATLADFELPRIYHGERMFALVYDRPSFFAPGHSFTKVARISYGKLDQWPSPLDRAPNAQRQTPHSAPPVETAGLNALHNCRPGHAPPG